MSRAILAPTCGYAPAYRGEIMIAANSVFGVTTQRTKPGCRRRFRNWPIVDRISRRLEDSLDSISDQLTYGAPAPRGFHLQTPVQSVVKIDRCFH